MAAFVVACGGGSSSSLPVQTSLSLPAGPPAPAPFPTQTPTIQRFSISVNFSAEGQTQIPSTVTIISYSIYDEENTLVASGNATRGSAFLFESLSSGNYLIRAEGLDSTGALVGFFDRIVTISTSNRNELLPGLRFSVAPPVNFEQTNEGPTFFLLTEVPDGLSGVTVFSVSARAFSSRGYPLLQVIDDLTLISEPIGFEFPVSAMSSNSEGVVEFADLTFPDGVSTETFFTIQSPDLGSARSSSVKIAPAIEFFRTVQRVSVNPRGEETNVNGNSFSPSLSSDGEFVCFQSAAENLVDNDSNGVSDVFLKNLSNGNVVRVSVNSSGEQANDQSSLPTISLDSQRVTFQSDASNLVENDTNGSRDIFVRDRQTQTTSLISKNSEGNVANGSSFAPSISGDGSRVAFMSNADDLVPGDTNQKIDIFVYDFTTDRIEIVSQGLGGTPASDDSRAPRISEDGRFVAFESRADNLVPGDTGRSDIFVFDLANQTTERVSVSSGGQEANNNSFEPALSADGRFVVFKSFSTDLVVGDTNIRSDIFLRDRELQTTTRVSRGPAGEEGDDDSDRPSISSDGRFVGFRSLASNFGDVPNLSSNSFVYDRKNDVTEIISRYNTGGVAPSRPVVTNFSPDGLLIAYSSIAQVIPEDTGGTRDVYVVSNPFRRGARSFVPMIPQAMSRFLELISVSSDGLRANNNSVEARPSVSRDGSRVVFASRATNFTPDDTTDDLDIYIRDREAQTTELLTTDGIGGRAVLAANGEFVAFQTAARLLPEDIDNNGDFYRQNLATGELVLVADELNSLFGTTLGTVLSEDGKFALASTTSRLDPNDTNGRFDAYLVNFEDGSAERLSFNSAGGEISEDIAAIKMTPDTKTCAFLTKEALLPNDLNGRRDWYLLDRDTGLLELATIQVDGSQFATDATDLAVSDNGSIVAYSVLNRYYVRNRTTGVVQELAEGGSLSRTISISGDGRFVAFTSRDNSLVPDDTFIGDDAFVFDRETDNFRLVSRDPDNPIPGVGGATFAEISGDGRFVVFASADRLLLVPGDPFISDLFIVRIVDP